MALLQLQKDSSVEKVELLRRLKVAEAGVSETDSNHSVRILQQDVKRLQQSKSNLEEENYFLRELCRTIPSISFMIMGRRRNNENKFRNTVVLQHE